MNFTNSFREVRQWVLNVFQDCQILKNPRVTKFHAPILEIGKTFLSLDVNINTCNGKFFHLCMGQHLSKVLGQSICKQGQVVLEASMQEYDFKLFHGQSISRGAESVINSWQSKSFCGFNCYFASRVIIMPFAHPHFYPFLTPPSSSAFASGVKKGINNFSFFIYVRHLMFLSGLNEFKICNERVYCVQPHTYAYSISCPKGGQKIFDATQTIWGDL